MVDQQLEIPMPVVGVQLTIRQTGSGSWSVKRSILRQDQGWQPGGTWWVPDARTAEVQAMDALGDAWLLDRLD